MRMPQTRFGAQADPDKPLDIECGTDGWGGVGLPPEAGFDVITRVRRRR
jgi:hypothetical protein